MRGARARAPRRRAPTRPFCAACHAGHRRQPAAAAPAADGARGRRRAPDAAQRGASCATRPARRVAHRAAAARAAAGRGRRGRARRRGARRGRRLPASRRSPGSTRTRVAERDRRLARAEILRPEPPLGFVHPLVRDAVYHELPPGERELQHERAAARAAATRGAPRRAGRRAAAASRRARGEAWVVDAAARGGRAAPRAGRGRERGRLPARARSRSRRRAERGPTLLLELGLAEVADGRPGGGRAPARGLRRARRPDARGARRRRARPRAAVHRRARGGGGARAARRRRAAGRARGRCAQRSRRSSCIAVFFGADAPRATTRLEPLPRPAPRRRRRARSKMLRRLAALRLGARAAARRDECVELALARARRRRADRPRTTDCCRSAPLRRRSCCRPRRGDREPGSTRSRRRTGAARCSAISAIHLWRGFTLLPARRAGRGRGVAAPGAARSSTRGASADAARMTTRAPSSRESLLERGDLAGRARALDARARPGATRLRRAPLLARTPAGAAARRGPRRGGARGGRRLDAAPRATCVQPGRRAAGARCKAQALDRLGRGDEAIALRRGGARAGARAWGAPGTVGARAAVLGTLRRRGRRSTQLRGGGRACSSGSPARLEHAKALAALGARAAARAAADARRASRCAGRSSWPTRAAPTALAEHVRAELYATGARPRTTALSGVERADRRASGASPTSPPAARPTATSRRRCS